jgi:hypothetical protein
LLNGVPGSQFHWKRGVRQGDPLSPFLFVLAADFLQSIINNAMAHGHLIRPIPLTSSLDFRVVQYANDTIIILQAYENQLLYLKDPLLRFGDASGLKVNYGKSNLIPINIPDDIVHVLLDALHC